MLKKTTNLRKLWRFSHMVFLAIGLVYAPKEHPFISSCVLKLLFSLVPSSYCSFTLQLLWAPKLKERNNGWKRKDERPPPGISCCWKLEVSLW